MVKKSNIILISVIICCIFVVFSGCIQERTQTIKLVSSLAKDVPFAPQAKKGIVFALEEAGYKAGKFNIEIFYEERNMNNAKEEEESIAQRAVDDKDVMVYIGPVISGHAKFSMPITNNGGLPHIGALNTWPGLTKAGFAPGEPGIFYPTGVRHYVRIMPPDDLQGPAAAIWAQELGFKNIKIFDDGGDYGKGVAKLFGEKAKDLGLNVIGQTSVNVETTDFKAELESLKNKNLDLVYFGGYVNTGAIPLAKTLKELGIEAIFMGPDALSEKGFIDEGGDAVEGAYITTGGLPPEKIKDTPFYKSYVEKFGETPHPVATFSYEATKVVLQAIERAGVKDRTKILNEIKNTKNYSGVYGSWSFTQTGDSTLIVFSGNKVNNGVFEYVKPLKV